MMSLTNRLMRYGIAFAAVGVIASQIPVSGVTALAANNCSINNQRYKVVQGRPFQGPNRPASDTFTVSSLTNNFTAYFDNGSGTFTAETSIWNISNSGWLLKGETTGTVGTTVTDIGVAVRKGKGTATLTAQSVSHPNFFVSVQLQ